MSEPTIILTKVSLADLPKGEIDIGFPVTERLELYPSDIQDIRSFGGDSKLFTNGNASATITIPSMEDGELHDVHVQETPAYIQGQIDVFKTGQEAESHAATLEA